MRHSKCCLFTLDILQKCLRVFFCISRICIHYSSVWVELHLLQEDALEIFSFTCNKENARTLHLVSCLIIIKKKYIIKDPPKMIIQLKQIKSWSWRLIVWLTSDVLAVSLCAFSDQILKSNEEFKIQLLVRRTFLCQSVKLTSRKSC